MAGFTWSPIVKGPPGSRRLRWSPRAACGMYLQTTMQEKRKKIPKERSKLKD